VERVGFVPSDSLDTLALILGIWARGAAYVPIYKHHPPERIREIVVQAAPDVICAEPEHLPATLAETKPPLILIPEATATQKPVSSPPEIRFTGPAPGSLAYILFTSGSTGIPKGVPITHRNLNTFFEAILTIQDYGFNPDDRFIQPFQYTFDLSVFSFLTPLLVGASVHLVPDTGQPSQFAILDTLEEQSITVAMLVPSVVRMLERYLPELQLPSLRLSLFCGEALPYSLAEAWGSTCPNARIENVYGPTETTIYCTRYVFKKAGTESSRPEPEAQSRSGSVPIGFALASASVRLLALEDESNPEIGELLILGEQLATGYWQNPEATARAFITLPDGTPAYRTGDRVRQDPETGRLDFIGRIDGQVKINGYRIELGDVENHAQQVLGHTAAVALAVPDTTGALRLHLVVQQTEPLAETELMNRLRSVLPPYMLPDRVTYVEALPTTTSGKTDRQALKRLIRGAE
jgi:amino acid adenylation domain-containing protein